MGCEVGRQWQWSLWPTGHVLGEVCFVEALLQPLEGVHHTSASRCLLSCVELSQVSCTVKGMGVANWQGLSRVECCSVLCSVGR